jgi:hypothetical protein
MLVNQKILMRIFKMIVKSVIYQLTIVNRKILMKIILMIVNQKIPMKIYRMMFKILIYLLIMCKNQHGRPTSNLSDGRSERTKKGKITGEHRWGAGQSSSDAFVSDLKRIINR